MAKVAAALRQKAEQEDAAYQARRSDQGLMESEWGPMEDAPPNEDPPMHVAVVEGDDAVRTLQWNRDVSAFDYPVGTLLYAARSQAKKGGESWPESFTPTPTTALSSRRAATSPSAMTSRLALAATECVS